MDERHLPLLKACNANPELSQTGGNLLPDAHAAIFPLVPNLRPFSGLGTISARDLTVLANSLFTMEGPFATGPGA